MTKQLDDNKFQLSVAMLFVLATSTRNKLRTFRVQECELLIFFYLKFKLLRGFQRQTYRQQTDRHTVSQADRQITYRITGWEEGKRVGGSMGESMDG